MGKRQTQDDCFSPVYRRRWGIKVVGSGEAEGGMWQGRWVQEWWLSLASLEMRSTERVGETEPLRDSGVVHFLPGRPQMRLEAVQVLLVCFTIAVPASGRQPQI